MIRSFLTLVLLSFIFHSCKEKEDYRLVFSNPDVYSEAVGALTKVITHDIFTPPVASRIYAYSNMAAFEVIASQTKDYSSLEPRLKDFKLNTVPNKNINTEFSALLAFLYAGQNFIFSKDSIQLIIDKHKVLAQKHGMPKEMINSSVDYAKMVSNSVINWSKKDNYKETRSAVKYNVSSLDESRWVPTPPAYMSAVEPNWMKIRPILLDSASQFLPVAPSKFSTAKDSKFYNLAKEVYETSKNLTDEQKAIADFWDCNGFKMNVAGHVMFATKAMTPGGHWMGITGIVCKNQNADFNKTVYAFTSVSIGIFDAFIACWNTKFTYDLIRPETYINQHIDYSWRPYLQTPPFPEYTSGHSIISSASAGILDKIFGTDTPFVDDTERAWGWPDRKFKNVQHAAEEASMSRIYGGIHYIEAINEGMAEGKKIADFVYAKFH
jgi:hypothetical protein